MEYKKALNDIKSIILHSEDRIKEPYIYFSQIMHIKADTYDEIKKVINRMDKKIIKKDNV